MNSDKSTRLRTGAELRSYLKDLIELSCRRTQEPFWVAIGDFDHLKHFNDLYGRPIIDYLHGIAKTLIEKRLTASEKRLAASETCLEASETCLEASEKSRHTAIRKCLFLGDEVMIVLPPSPPAQDDIHSFLSTINQQVHELFSMQYIVAALSIEGGGWEYRAPQESCELSRALEAQGIVLDPVPRKKGYLTLIRLADKQEEPAQAAHRTLTAVRRYLNDDDIRVEYTFQWVSDPDRHRYEAVNEGYLMPLSLSWGAVSSQNLSLPEVGPGNAGGAPITDEARSVDTLLDMAHRALRQSKAKRSSVTALTERPLHKSHKPGTDCMAFFPEKPYNPHRTRYPIISDEYLHHVLGELSTKERAGTLVQFEKSYLAGPDSPSCEQMHRRGLKAINDHYGYGIGDLVICLLESVFHQELGRFCRSRRIRRADVHISRFVDLFTVYFFNSNLTVPSIRHFAARVLKEFNTHASGISLASLSASVVYNREKLRGFELARRLAVTALCGKTSLNDELKECITVKEYSPSCEERAMGIVELNAARSARIITSRIRGICTPKASEINGADGIIPAQKKRDPA
ncbi:MAG: hypothetical protein AB2L14_17820 [Candidatus Xenobiia bacterium LiM19]